MLYAFLGSAFLGALASALLLWRKSVVEKTLAEVRGQLLEARNEAEGWKQSYQMSVDAVVKREAQLGDKLVRVETELQTVKDQRNVALEKLVKSGAPGSIADLLRTHAGASSSVSSDPKSPKS